jgi:hypothetical protein
MKSRTEVVNDSLERDRIVSMSDGFILSSKVLREEHLPDGTVRVRIIAQVVDEQTQAPDVGNRSQAVLSDRSADAASRADRQRNAAEMLGLVLEEARYPLGMFHATPTRPRMNKGTDFTELTWTTKLHANDAAWSRFVRDSGRALAALGAADSIVPWHARAAGRRLRDLTTAPPTIGRLADGSSDSAPPHARERSIPSRTPRECRGASGAERS